MTSGRAAPRRAAVHRPAVGEAGHPASRVVELPGLNHLFQAAPTGAPAEYSTIEETINAAALELFGD